MASLVGRLLTQADPELDDIFKSSAGSSLKRPKCEDPPRPDDQPKNKKAKHSISVLDPFFEHGKDSEDAELSGHRRTTDREKRKSKNTPNNPESISKTERATQMNDPPLLHETMAQSGSRRGPRIKYAPADETHEEVDARTVFVGNLPSLMIKQKSSTKALTKHLLSFLPDNTNAIIESTRFRSVGFNAPKEGSTNDDYSRPTTIVDHDPETEQAKSYLTTNQKKRLAFIKGELNPNAQVVNCYVVFGHKPPSSDTDGKDDTMKPAEVAHRIVKAANSSTFMGRTIRVDHVGSATKGSKKEDARKTVFVGGLDFEAKEDDVRSLFEALVTDEMGDPKKRRQTETRTVEKGGGNTMQTWVSDVRVVRDASSQLGKGVAYVRFNHADCVDEVLAIPEEKLTLADRPIRVQRCKTVPHSTSAHKASAAASSSSPHHGPETSTRRPTKQSGGKTKAPPGPKDERKLAKANDPERAARRLEKKKRVKLEKLRMANKPDKTRPRTPKDRGPKNAKSGMKKIRK